MSVRNLRGPNFESLSVCGDLFTETKCFGDELDHPTPNISNISFFNGGFLMKVAEFGPNWSDFEQLSFSTKLQLITLPSSHTTYTLTSSTNISLQNTNTRSMIIPNETLTCCISLYVGYAKVKKEHYDRIHVHGIASLTAESRNSARLNNWSLSLDCTLEAELPILVYGQMNGMIEVIVEGIFQIK